MAGPYPNLATRITQDYAWFAPFVSACGNQFSGKNYTVTQGFDVSVVSTVWNNITINGGLDWPVKPGSRCLGVISKTVTPNSTVIVQVWDFTATDTYWTSHLIWDLPEIVEGYPPRAFIIWIQYN